MVTKDKIIEEIKRTAKMNGGKPLGVARFQSETGINPYDWSKYWPRFGDAQKEAGFVPNQLQGAHADKFLMQKIIVLARKIGKFPTYSEIHAAKSNDPEFPSRNVFHRLGTKNQFAAKVLDYCNDDSNYEDIRKMCEEILETEEQAQISIDETDNLGEVYLFKSGRFYKIGKTKDTVRRGSELKIQLPEKIDLIHAIKTDDPSGIESYWHKRFESKRMNGEWFDLTSADIKTFKRWKKIY